MKMNKFGVLMSASALMLCVGCSQESTVVSIPDTTPITFKTFADKATKAATATDLEYYHETMAVYGKKKDADNLFQTVFDKVTVTANASGDWTYSPIRYWDKQASYEFVAFAPAGAPLKYVASGDGALSTTGSRFVSTDLYTLSGQNLQQDAPSTSEKLSGFTGGTSKDYDMMVSSLVSQKGSLKGTVNLTFKHLLAKLNITVAAASSDAVIKVKSIEVTGLFDSGRYVGSASGDASGDGWKASDKTTPSTYKLSYTCASGEAASSDAKYFVESLVMPQTGSNGMPGHIKMVYTITTGGTYTESFTYNKDIKDIFTAISSYKRGNKYTINFTINTEGEEIKFDAGVTEWTDGNTASEQI